MPVDNDFTPALEEAAAKVRLNAAGPDMLAALKECATRLRYDADLFSDQGLQSRALASWRSCKMAEDAIAKAEGKP